MLSADRLAVLRILDAAANRAGEGLRVVEDYARFALNDPHLARLGKELRHDLAAALANLSAGERLTARDTQRDVGTEIATPSEAERADLRAVVAANLKRAEQALRSLEEFGKTCSGPLAATCERLRYRLYTLEKALDLTARARERLADVRLYLLLDGGASPDDCAARARMLLTAGVDAIQLRDKSLGDRELLARARRLREVTAAAGRLLIVNDRPDLAVLARADGVHVGQEELPVHEVRAIVGPELLIGVSTHSLAQARQAVLDGASYLGVGPVFPSPTKQFAAHVGLDLVREIAGEIGLPWFAIGGVAPVNVAPLTAAGARRAAVSSGVLASADPAAAAQLLRDRLTAEFPAAP